MSIMPPSSPEQSVPTWLERLPQPALNNIVAVLQDWDFSGEAQTETYALAFTSDSLRKSVQKSLGHQVQLFSSERIGSAVALFPSGVKSFRLTSMPTEHPAIFHFLRAPSLETVTIPTDEHLTSALLVKKSVRHLEIEMNTENNGEHVISLLRALPLTKLSLSCYVHSPAKACLFNSELSDPQHENCIAGLCPDLQELNVKCGRDNRHAIFWRMFPNLSLKRARLHWNVRKEALHQLRNMESIELDNVKDPVYHAERLGRCVTSFDTMDILEDVDLRIMQSCPRLKVLKISVKVERSHELCELVSVLPELRVLKLTFNRHTMYSGKRGKVTYDRMDDGDSIRLVEAAAAVEELDLMGLQVPGEEIVHMLRVLGGRLKIFRTCLKGQDEAMLERLERLLESLCRFSYGLEIFDVWESYDLSAIKSNLRRKGKDLAKRRRQQKEVGKRLSQLLDVLKRRSRWTDSHCLYHGRGIGELVEILL